MGWIRKIWEWIFCNDPLDEIFTDKPKFKKKIKARFIPDTKEKILKAKLKTYRDEGLVAWIRNRKQGKQICFNIFCCRCKKRSNTSSYQTAKRSKNRRYLCQECWDKQKAKK